MGRRVTGTDIFFFLLQLAHEKSFASFFVFCFLSSAKARGKKRQSGLFPGNHVKILDRKASGGSTTSQAPSPITEDVSSLLNFVIFFKRNPHHSLLVITNALLSHVFIGLQCPAFYNKRYVMIYCFAGE